MTDEILYGLMDVFKRANNQYLTRTEITHRMKERGFYKDVDFVDAAVDVYLHYLNPPIFHEIKRSEDGNKRWNVAHWLPSKENNLQNSAISLLQAGKEIQRTASPSESEIKNGIFPLHEQGKENSLHDSAASVLQIGEEIQRTISHSGFEIEDGIIPLYGQDFNIFFASMDKEQQRQLNINIHYYASEHITCEIAREHDRWFLKDGSVKSWYQENQIEPGDKIWLVVENIAPLAIRIYTEWERNHDTYRRHRQLQSGKPIISVDMPIRDIIWDFLDKTQKIIHRLDIGKAVLEKRPEISEQSVYACLSSNPYLFVRVGEGYWGLKEWGLEEVEVAVRPVESTLEENPDIPTEIVPLDYILANIAAKNLVYRILEESSPNALTVGEITERISKYLGVNKDVLARATFFDPSDPRFYRQEDGTFTLRKNLEEVIHHLSENERAFKAATENKIQKLEETIESIATKSRKESKQLKEERDSLKKLAVELIEQIERYEKINEQRKKRFQILSEFLAEAVPNIGQGKLEEIFERLHHKAKTRNATDANEIVKFSNIIRKFLPRLKD